MHISPNGKRRNLEKSAAFDWSEPDGPVESNPEVEVKELGETPAEPVEAPQEVQEVQASPEAEVKTAMGHKNIIKIAQPSPVAQPGTQSLPGVGDAQQEPAANPGSCPNPRCERQRLDVGPIGAPCPDCGTKSVHPWAQEMSDKEQGSYGTSGLGFLAKSKGNIVRISSGFDFPG